MSMADALYSRLSGFAGLSALVAARVYPLRAPQGAALPYVTFQRVHAERESAMGVDVGVVHARIQVSAWGKTFTEAEAVKEQVRAALQRWSGTAAGVVVLDSFVVSEIELYEDETGIHQHALDFTIHYRE